MNVVYIDINQNTLIITADRVLHGDYNLKDYFDFNIVVNNFDDGNIYVKIKKEDVKLSHLMDCEFNIKFATEKDSEGFVKICEGIGQIKEIPEHLKMLEDFKHSYYALSLCDE